MGNKQRFVLCALLMVFVLSPPAFAVRNLIASGMPVGVRMTADGVVVCGMEDIQGELGKDCPAKEAGLRTGDILCSVDGTKISSGAEFAAAVHRGGGAPVVVEGERDGTAIRTTVRPVQSTADGRYHLGLLVRDSMAGIGMVTYVDPKDGSYGALGHAVTEIDSGTILPLQDGSLMPAAVVGITKGRRGMAGELTGAFQLETNLGSIEKNTANGIFGIMHDGSITGTPVSVAETDQVRTGNAQILTCLDGSKPKKYSIVIDRIHPNGGNRSLSIRVTDKQLLERTGGIVQGMSGSPILQDGRLVGAVTHVLLSDPQRGYGILIGDMLAS